MPYPEMMIAPMREDLRRIGFTELKTAADVDGAMRAYDMVGRLEEIASVRDLTACLR